MVYKLKIYVKGIRKIDLICDENFYKVINDDLSNPDVQFLDLENIVIPKAGIKKIKVESIENK